jgi:glycerate kinase
VPTAYARKGGRAVIELADVSGPVRLSGSRPAPLVASSRGTGDVLAAPWTVAAMRSPAPGSSLAAT